MNKTEQSYATGTLDVLKLAGEIAAYWFESVKLRLADRTFYTPDFLVQLADGTLEFHEVKGFWEDDARVKVKVAAEQYPLFRFIAVTKRKKEWVREEF